MRTTCEFDDDVMRRVREVAAERGCSMKVALNDALRAGLTESRGARGGNWTCRSYDLGTAKIDYARAWDLVDTLDAESVAEKLRLRK